MVLYPEVQRKAQSEIDAVIGNVRLPVCGDRDSLPYVNALVLEVFRWHSVAPGGVPHMAKEDASYKGHFIPKGSTILPNVWGMAHDPTVYHDPMVFNPDRFLSRPGYKPEPDPRSIAFGFGRRICPGRVLADTSVFLSCAMALAVFNISAYKENGKPILPDILQLSGVVRYP
ncbi:cytochrome P450, partial [Pluteus cervinus]